MLTGEPWVRWPPAARSSPMNVSPGCISAMNTPWLAWLPECGWTLAKRQANSCAGALDRQVFRDVDELAAAVIAPPGIAFGVFVGQHRALRLEHRARRRCFRRRSARSRRAGGRARDSTARAISGSASASAAEKNELERIGRGAASFMSGGFRVRSWRTHAKRPPECGRRIARTGGGGQRRGERERGMARAPN